MKTTTYRFDTSGCLMQLLVLVVVGAAVIAASVYGSIYAIAFITGDAFDGNIAEPGCDWGGSHCEVEDYREMCLGELAQDEPPSVLRQHDFCSPIGEAVE